MRSTVTLTITLDHSVDLPYRDGQAVADAVSRLLTADIAADPLASAHTLLAGAAISKMNDRAFHEYLAALPDQEAALHLLDERYHRFGPCPLCGVEHASVAS